VNGKIFMDYFLEKDVYFGIGGRQDFLNGLGD
jgi:hypothetical protein